MPSVHKKHQIPKQNQDWVFLYKREPIEITDYEWDTILHSYWGYYDGMMTLGKKPMIFAQYLRELVELARIK